MEDFSKRGNQGRFLLRFLRKIVGLAFLLVLAVIAVRASFNMYDRFAQAVQAQENAQERLATLTTQKDQVGTAVEAFDSSRGIEAEVRERYGVARPGEGRIEIVRDSTSTTASAGVPLNPILRFFRALWPF